MRRACIALTLAVTLALPACVGNSEPPGASGTTTTAAEAEFPGIGTTGAHWERSHEQVPGSPRGSAYLPFLRDGRQAAYAAVFGDDRVLTYQVYMESGTSLDQVSMAILKSPLVANESPHPRVG